MAIQVPNETPAIQQYLASGLTICSQSSAEAASASSPGPPSQIALAAAHAAEIEAQHREAALGERIIEAVDDLVVHRAAELRVRMQDQRDRASLAASWW